MTFAFVQANGMGTLGAAGSRRGGNCVRQMRDFCRKAQKVLIAPSMLCFLEERAAPFCWGLTAARQADVPTRCVGRVGARHLPVRSGSLVGSTPARSLSVQHAPQAHLRLALEHRLT